MDDLTPEEIEIIIKVLKQLTFNTGQSKLVATIEQIVEKLTPKQQDN